VALARISKFLSAEELDDYYAVDESLPDAVSVDGYFTWETAGKLPDDTKPSTTDQKREVEVKKREKKDKKDKSKKGKKATDQGVLPTTTEKTPSPADEMNKEGVKDEEKFELKNLKLRIPKGSFVAIIGRVGSGKVLLQPRLVKCLY